MRVKVGNQWFSATNEQPIAIELSHVDFENIQNMHPDATRLGVFTDECPLTAEEKYEWLDE